MIKPTTADHSKEVGTSGDLEGLVVISGPCSSLPDRCTRRRQIPAPQYRPQVEHHDNTERLYSKHKLPLFEILHETNHLQDTQSNEDGPAAAVLRRRRQKRWCAAAEKGEGEREEEDLTDEHYRRLHRKPEYLEKRVRNRELELYQYARWREAQMRNAEVASASAVVVEEKHEAVGRPAKPNTDNDDKEEEEGDEGRDQTAVVASAKRQRVSNELKGLADSPGFARAREKAASTPSATVAIAAEVKIPPATSVAPAGAVSADSAEAERGDLPVLSLAERRVAHLGGCILEQLLVQAAHLPADESREADSDPDSDEGDGGDDEDEGSGSEPANNGEGDNEENSKDEEAGAVLGCCCPREFALPVRLYGHTMKQRDRG